jgi:hypothetical protein
MPMLLVYLLLNINKTVFRNGKTNNHQIKAFSSGKPCRPFFLTCNAILYLYVLAS